MESRAILAVKTPNAVSSSAVKIEVGIAGRAAEIRFPLHKWRSRARLQLVQCDVRFGGRRAQYYYCFKNTIFGSESGQGNRVWEIVSFGGLGVPAIQQNKLSTIVGVIEDHPDGDDEEEEEDECDEEDDEDDEDDEEDDEDECECEDEDDDDEDDEEDEEDEDDDDDDGECD